MHVFSVHSSSLLHRVDEFLHTCRPVPDQQRMYRMLAMYKEAAVTL
jgi:hypothetical protein